MHNTSESNNCLNPNSIFILTHLFCLLPSIAFYFISCKAQKDFLITAPQIIASDRLSALLSPYYYFPFSGNLEYNIKLSHQKSISKSLVSHSIQQVFKERIC